MSEEIKIIEKVPIPSVSNMVFGFPDVGLVGVIATSHLISELKLKEIAYLDSKLLPPLIVLHEGLPHSPIRVFGNDEVLIAVSETPISTDTLNPIVNSLIDWGKNKKTKMMISLSGIPIQTRQDIQEPKVFAAASTLESLSLVKEKGLEVLMEGYMVGPQAMILQNCAKTDFPAIALLAQCFLNYPDPEAAAEVVKGLQRITGLKVDVSKLLEKGEDIRLRARDIMKRTQKELTRMKKSQEYDLPLYVS